MKRKEIAILMMQIQRYKQGKENVTNCPDAFYLCNNPKAKRRLITAQYFPQKLPKIIKNQNV